MPLIEIRITYTLHSSSRYGNEINRIWKIFSERNDNRKVTPIFNFIQFGVMLVQLIVAVHFTAVGVAVLIVLAIFASYRYINIYP